MSALFAAFGVDWHLLLIQAVNFLLLLGVLTYFLYRPILRIIDERRETVAEGVRLAQMASKKLEDAKTQSEQMVGEAAHRAEELAAAARARSEEVAAEKMRTTQARAADLLKEAQERAEEAQRQALKESEQGIARAAMLAAEKLLREKSA